MEKKSPAAAPPHARPPYVPGTPEETDAVIAAPENHEVLFQIDQVRVLRVTIQPGEVEKKHTHKWPGVFTIYRLPKIRYYDEKGNLCLLPEVLEEGKPF
jgi:quercetin dioxygenase-like cupin family protein